MSNTFDDERFVTPMKREQYTRRKHEKFDSIIRGHIAPQYQYKQILENANVKSENNSPHTNRTGRNFASTNRSSVRELNPLVEPNISYPELPGNVGHLFAQRYMDT